MQTVIQNLFLKCKFILDKNKNNQKKDKKENQILKTKIVNKNNLFKAIKKLENKEIKSYNQEILKNKNIDYEKSLSHEQKRALTAIDGIYLVIAGAGSGKTRTIVYRTALLLELGISPANILMITFTKKAALEMKDRIEVLLKKPIEDMTISTFHSFCAKIILENKNIFRINTLNILEEQEKLKLIKNLIKKYNVKRIKQNPFPSIDRIQEILTIKFMTKLQSEKILTKKEKNYFDEIEKIIKEYIIYKNKNKILEYDDLINIMINKLESNKSFKEYLQKIFKYIIVDEYQDSNEAQRRLLMNLVGTQGNLMVVGDDYQSIYGFRGGNFENILKFSDDFKNSNLIKLETNYRSTDEIINYCNKIASKFNISYNKIAQGTGKHDKLPIITKYNSQKEEAEQIAAEILKLHMNGVKYSDIAILYRNKFAIKHILEEIKKNKIPYYIKTENSNEDHKNQTKDQLSIVTVHSSKGLEWEYVFIGTLLDGIFPADTKEEILEEEKRLYYVGCSRAKKQLYLSYPKFFYEKTGFYDTMSQFLKY